jgi:hypothetical protein
MTLSGDVHSHDREFQGTLARIQPVTDSSWRSCLSLTDKGPRTGENVVFYQSCFPCCRCDTVEWCNLLRRERWQEYLRDILLIVVEYERLLALLFESPDNRAR